MTDESQIETLVTAYLTPDPRYPNPGAALRALGPVVVPALSRAYEQTGRWKGRAALLVAATFHARVSDEAVALGLRALQDRATVVRYRACGLLAYAGRREAVRALEALLTSTDEATRADAAAAITAIQSGNHHRFVDRAGTGRITWEVNASDGPAPERDAGSQLTSWWHRMKRLLFLAVAVSVGAPASAQIRVSGRGCTPDTTRLVQHRSIEAPQLAGSFRLARIWTQLAEARRFDSLSYSTLQLSVVDSMQRIAAQRRSLGRQPRRNLQLVGSVREDGRQRAEPAEVDNGVLYLGCRDCTDASPTVFHIAKADSTGFTGTWRDYQTSIGRVLVRRIGEPSGDPAGYFCARRK